MKVVLTLIFLLTAFRASADPAFTNITDAEFTDISREMSANFTHSSLLGASKLGTLFGFQVGIVGAQTSSPKTNDVVKRNAGSELPSMYNAGLMGVVGVPFGVSAEAVIIPTVTASGAKLTSTSLALKWNINDVIPVLPVNLALRGLYSTSKFSFSQVISAVNATVEDSNKVTGVQLLFSPMIPFIEPYVGVGFLNATNDLSVTGTSGTVFDTTFTSSQTASKTVTSTQYILGVEASLLLIKLGAEYSQSFGTSRIGVKFALGF